MKAEYGLRLASHIFVKDISPESLAARDGNIQEGDVVLKVSKQCLQDRTCVLECLQHVCTFNLVGHYQFIICHTLI